MKIKEIRCKSILTKTKLPACDYVINPYVGCSFGCVYCYSRFMKRFTGHKEAWGQFVDIKINYNPVFKNQLEVYIIKENGDIDDVSVLRNCITGKPKDNLKIAMRVAIQPQIYQFRLNQSKLVCELCNNSEKIEIDHHSEKTPFAKLYIDFMEGNSLSIPTSFDDTDGHLKCFKKEDYNFEKIWFDYHKNNAILRILCKKCNSSQLKYKK